MNRMAAKVLWAVVLALAAGLAAEAGETKPPAEPPPIAEPAPRPMRPFPPKLAPEHLQRIRERIKQLPPPKQQWFNEKLDAWEKLQPEERREFMMRLHSLNGIPPGGRRWPRPPMRWRRGRRNGERQPGAGLGAPRPPHGRPPFRGKRGRMRGRMRRLTPEQREKMRERMREHRRRFPPQKRRRFNKHLKDWEKLTDEERRKLRERLEKIRKLPPEERRRLQERTKRWREFSDEERERLRREYRRR